MFLHLRRHLLAEKNRFWPAGISPDRMRLARMGVVVFFCLINFNAAKAASIDPYKGRWRVDVDRSLDNFRINAPGNVPRGGFPNAILKSMKLMSLEISRKRFVFRLGKRKVINSRFEIISLSDDGIMMRITVRNKIREQLLSLTSRGRLRVIAMTGGKPEPRASANHYIWNRIVQVKTKTNSVIPIPRPKPNPISKEMEVEIKSPIPPAITGK